MDWRVKIIGNFSNHFFFFFLIALLSLGMTSPLIFHLTDHVPSDLGDPFYNIWVMSWVSHRITAGFQGFWDGNIFHPYRGTLLYADYIPALAILSMPLSAITGNIILAYNFMFIASFFFCGLGMYFLVLHLTQSRASAFISSLIFAFFPYKFAHIAHLELLSFAFMPFCFLFLHKFFERPTLKNLFSFAFFYVFQALSCAYYGVFLSIFVVFFILFFAYHYGFFFNKDFWIKIGAVAAAVFLLLFPLFYPYIRVHQEMELSRPFAEIELYSAQLQDLAAVPPWNWLLGNLTGRMSTPERQLYPGIIPVLLTFFWWFKKRRIQKCEENRKGRKIFSWWGRLTFLYLVFLAWIWKSGGFELRIHDLRFSVHRLRNPLIILGISLILRIFLDKILRARLKKYVLSFFSSARDVRPEMVSSNFYLFTAILSLLFSLGPVIRIFAREIIEGPCYLLYLFIPGFKGLRAPSRFAVIMMLALSVLSGMSLKYLGQNLKKKIGMSFLVFLLTGFILVEYVSVPLPLVPVKVGDKIPAVYKTVKGFPEDSAIIELPMAKNNREEPIEALSMYYSIFHQKRLVNGYSGYTPPGYRIVREAMESFPSENTFDLLRDLKVEYILIHTTGYREEEGRRIARAMDNFREHAELIEKNEGDYLFKLKPKEENPQTGVIFLIERKDNWKTWSSVNVIETKYAFDKNMVTAWSTPRPQRKGDFFYLDLASCQEIGQIELSLGRNPLNYPRGYQLFGSVDGWVWHSLSKNQTFFPQFVWPEEEGPPHFKAIISFRPRKIRYLKMTLTRSHETYPWTIQEIQCFGKKQEDAFPRN